MTPDITKIPSGAPTGSEIKTVTKHLKSNKTSGLDNLPPEISKTYPQIVIIKAIYHQLTCNVLHKNQVSEPPPVLNGVE
jgi:hypothetical protein